MGNEYAWRMGRLRAVVIAAAGEYLSPLRVRSVGSGMASKAGARRCDRRAVRGRHRGWIPERNGCQTVSCRTHRAVSEVQLGTASRQNAASGVRAVRGPKPGTARRREAGNVRLPWLHAYLREDEKPRLLHGAAADGS